MAYVPAYTRLGEQALNETRTVTTRGKPGLPDEEYAYLELYCDDPGCDCRRVMLQVFTQTSGRKVLATISYGWESPQFYEKSVGDREVAHDYNRATLDPLNLQTEYSDTLLQLFLDLVLTDVYVERLKRHYRMFKADVKKSRRDGMVRKSPKKKR